MENTMQNTSNTPAERSADPLLHRGDLVEVYQYPLTDENPEGIARLVRPLADVDPATGVQNWAVKFPGEDEEYHRFVHPRHRKG